MNNELRRANSEGKLIVTIKCRRIAYFGLILLAYFGGLAYLLGCKKYSVLQVILKFLNSGMEGKANHFPQTDAYIHYPSVLFSKHCKMRQRVTNLLRGLSVTRYLIYSGFFDWLKENSSLVLIIILFR